MKIIQSCCVTGRVKMVRITNVVCKADLGVDIDLRYVAMNVRDVRYNPGTFNGLIWQNRTIGGTCLLFRNGKVICNGNRTFTQARKRVRCYARYIEKRLGLVVNLKKVQLVTKSAVHELTSPFNCAVLSRCVHGASYEPEVMNAVMVKRNNIHFTCFTTGKIIITGIKNSHCLKNIVYPTLLELEISS